MNAMTNRLAGRISITLVTALLLTILAPAYAAEKAPLPPIAISSITDALGSININVGKGEGIKEGSKGVIIRDGKQIAKYIVQQVNWGFSRITVFDVAEGYTIRPGDSAPLDGTAEKAPTVKRKSSKSKTLLTVLAIGAAVLLLGGKSGGGSSSGGSIDLTSVKSSNVTDAGRTGTIDITARVNDSNGLPAPDGTPVTFASTAGTLDRTQTVTSAGRATAKLSYDSSVDPDSATVTVRALGRTATIEVSFVSSIEITTSAETIQVKDSGGSVMQATITATCWTSAGVLANSGTVTFTTNIGTISNPTVSIGADGTASTTFTSNVTGKANITATWQTKNKATIPITVTAGPPYSLSVSSDTSTVQCDGNSFATIKATVKDMRGTLATDGTVVNFAVIPAGNGTITPQAVTVNGVATAYLHTRNADGSVSSSGTVTLKVDVLRANQPSDVPLPASDMTNQSTQVQFVSTRVGSINLSATPTNVRGWDVVGNTTTIKAVVYNTDGQPVPNGTAVYFTTTRGVVTGTSGNMSTTTNGIATATLTTDASGNDSWDGRVDVIARAGTVTQSAPGLVIFSGPAVDAQSDVTLSQTNLPTVGGQSSIIVVAKDMKGNPIADGTKVTVTTTKGTLSDGGNGTTTGGQCVITLSTSTDTATPTPAGPGEVRVSIDTGGVPVTKTLSFTVGP